VRLYDYAASANCLKARILIGLLGLDIERVAIDIFAGETLTGAFARLNPVRETPVLELDDGTTVTQSNAILWYLAEGTPYLPDTVLGRAQVVQWLSFEQERVMSGIGSARFRLLTGRQPELVGPRLETGRGALSVLDGHLAERAWLVGDGLSIADIAVYAYAHVAPDAGLELAPAVAGWIARLEALPGFVDDLAPYPENALPGRSRSIYDTA
jgi:glutathione S-transferase